MKKELLRIVLAAIIPLFILFIMYCMKILEVGMDWDFSRLGIYPLQKQGFFGVFAHPLIHSGFRHLLSNTLPFFILAWCLFYFYRHIAPYILFCIWIGCGILTFIIGKPGWHIGASGIIYGLAFFLFFSGLLRKHIPLIAISLLITFLYGGLVWSMFPHFVKITTSWEGHLSGGIMGVICAFAFLKQGPQRPTPFEDEDEDEEDEENDDTLEAHNQESTEIEQLSDSGRQ